MNPKAARAEATGSSDTPPTVFRGRQLLLARVAWAAVAVLTVGLFAAGVPSEFARLKTVCTDAAASCAWIPRLAPNKAQELRELGLSVDFFAAYFVAIEIIFAVVSSAVGVIIFLRKSDERTTIFASLALLAFGVTLPGPLFALSELHPAWKLPTQSAIFLGSALVILFLYLFPDGQFVPRWTRLPAAATIALVAPTVFFVHSPLDWLRYPLFFTLVTMSGVGTVLCAQIYRYRRVSRPLQRQQTKWVIFGMAAALGGFLGIVLLAFVLPRGGVLVSMAGNTALFLFMLIIPLSIGLAILKHRLYDIDVLINRALVYGSLTALLALVYFGGVTAAQTSFQRYTGQEELPQLVIVASTLLIAALFSPLRRRTQSFIDRRFYRRKYDAAKTLAAFNARLRDETELDALCDDVVGVVRQTMQPAHVSLWLSPDKAPDHQQTD